MKTLQLILASCAFSVAVLVAPSASAHAMLKASSPASGAVLKTSPTEITLTFNEQIEQAFSSVTVASIKGKAVKTEKGIVDPNNAAVMRVRLAKLPAGMYTVKWAVAGHDGHRRTGNFPFSVK